MMKRMWTMSLTGLCLTVLLFSTALAQTPARSGRTPRSAPADSGGLLPDDGREPQLPTGPNQPTRLELAVFDLSCPTGIAAGIDLNRITAGDASPAVILDRLQQYGQASTVFRADDVINLPAGAEITQGCRAPTVQDVVVSRNGVVTPSVTYEKVGAIVKIRGQWRQDDAQLADVVCRINTSAVVDSPVQVASGVILPAFADLSVKQTLQVRHGRPTCWLLSGTPLAHEAESISHLYIFYLSLARAGEPTGPAPTAAAGTPQTMVMATILEIEGDKEKLAEIDLNKEPPTDPAKLVESLSWYGKVREVARPSLLAIWPSKSTITTGWNQPVIPQQVTTEPAEPRSRRGKETISYQRAQLEFTIDGRWSDGNPQKGIVTIELEKRQEAGQNRELVKKDLITSTATIENNKPLCILGKVVSADGQDQARRCVICLTARRIEEKKEAAPSQTK